MKLLLLTDTHAGARNDSTLFNNYFLKFYEKVLFPYIADNDITNVIHLGDVFDRRKYVNFLTLNTWRKSVFEKLNAACKTHIIQGNHDLYYKESNEVDSLGELFLSYKNIEIINAPTELEFDGTKILLLPWVQAANEEICRKKMSATQAQILFGHFDILGFAFHRGITNTELGFDPKEFENFDVVCSGHYHHRSHKGNIHYLGTPYEIDWHDVDDPKGFHIFDTDTRKLKFIENPYRMHHKVLYDDTGGTFEKTVEGIDFSVYTETYVKVIVRNKTSPYIFDQFLQELQKNSPADVSVLDEVVDTSDTDDDIDETKDTLTLLVEYVDNMPIDDNKKKPLVNLLTKIYKEANELDV